ncbi:hypothetical protein BC829DRAFT_396512 [Chytridium lagenaria]|nr:hypothetical protein BC829DRAFT_396512 [Chytridium lagenaria]
MDPPSREEALNNVARHTVDASEYSCVSWPVICRISPETGSRTQIDSAGLFYDPSNTACAIEDFTDKGTVIMSLGVIETKLCKSVSDAFMGVTCCNTDECNRPQARPADVPLNSKTYTAPTDGKARSCFASNIMDLSDPPIKMDPSTAEIMGYNGCTRYPVFYESSIAYMHWGANVTDCNLNQPLYVKDLCCFEDYCNYPLVF